MLADEEITRPWAGLPTEIAEAECWYAWITDGSGTGGREFFNPVSGQRYPDPGTTLLNAARRATLLFTGIGAALPAGVRALVLGNCRNPETEGVRPWAQEIIDALDTYVEIRDGTSLTVLVRSTAQVLTAPWDLWTPTNPVSLTGKRLPGARTTIEDRTGAMSRLFGND